MSRPLQLALLLLLAIYAAAPAARAQQQTAKPPGIEQTQPEDLPTARPGPLRLDTISLPPGFKIEMFVDDIIPARFMALGQADEQATVVYVSTSAQSVVYAIVDRFDGKPTVCVLLQGMNLPNGIAYDKETRSLYIAAVRLCGGDLHGEQPCRRAVLARLPCLEVSTTLGTIDGTTLRRPSTARLLPRRLLTESGWRPPEID